MDLNKTYSNLFLASSSEEDDDGKKWWEKDETNAEYEGDIDIPLVMTGGDVMVEDTQDVYAMPTHSPKKKDEPQSTYYNLDPIPAASPSLTKKKSVILKFLNGPITWYNFEHFSFFINVIVIIFIKQKKKKKPENRPSVMVEDTQDVYSIPDIQVEIDYRFIMIYLLI